MFGAAKNFINQIVLDLTKPIKRAKAKRQRCMSQNQDDLEIYRFLAELENMDEECSDEEIALWLNSEEDKPSKKIDYLKVGY